MKGEMGLTYRTNWKDERSVKTFNLKNVKMCTI
jgi:hypothetical protein